MFYLPPHPSALFGSLRGVGYPVAASIADLIDNSISAGSRDVRIAFVWRGETSRILLADDGVGMSQATLVEAMRLGCGGPSMGRSPHDLGRFGMGLKTASLAHCRRLTVVSKKANAEPSSARWDLVEISRHGEWRLETQTSHEGGAEWQWFTSRIQGTLVVWDDLDRMVPSGTRADDARAKTDFLRTAEDVAIHCGMVFHRFISTGRLRIQVGSNLDNGSYCKPWDPMLESHPDSWKTPEAHLDGGVTLRGFVLPRPERFLSKKDRDAAGGPEGWVAQQGLHVYRGDRLLQSGGWMGLREGGRAWTRDPSCQLARIRIEFPSSADAEWALDISKRHARIPDRYRTRVMTLVRMVRERAKKVWLGRPQLSGGHGTKLWQPGFLPNDPWKINRDHPILTEIRAVLGSSAPLLTAVVTMLERGQPISSQAGRADAGAGAACAAELPPTEEEITLISKIIQRFHDSGMSKEVAVQRMAAMEPFDSMTSAVRRISDHIYL